MKPRTTSLFTVPNILLIIIFTALLLLFIISAFGPIQARLLVFEGFRIKDGHIGFEEGKTTYIVDIDGGDIVGVKALNTNFLGGEDNATYTYHYEKPYRSSSVTIDLTYDGQEAICTHVFPYDNGETETIVDCDTITLTDEEVVLVARSILYHKSNIRRNLDWRAIPERNHPE